ncbi:MAG: PKD domain-containing protein [Gemmatimonadetes bacterium]|nr:PKD domain-containing protein [Gemmatimonadota bacterium]
MRDSARRMPRGDLPARLASGLAVLLLLCTCAESPTNVRETPVEAAAARTDLTPSAGDPVLVGAGDIASCSSGGDEITAALLDAIPGTVFTAGDNAYANGTEAQYLNCYAPSWGRHRERTRPVAGNHDYVTPGAAPYFAYFDTLAGPSGRGYYSYDLGAWHLIALDSNIPSDASSAQYRWLQADLAAHSTACAAAYWHHARFSSSLSRIDVVDNALSKAARELLDKAGVDVVLNGHYHHYERFAPQDGDANADPNGMREFIVGLGGRSLGTLRTARPNSEVRYNGSFGVFKLTLHSTSYSWKFVPEPGATFTDTGTAECVYLPGPPLANAGGPYSGKEGSAIALDGSGSSDPEGQALSYAWDFDDGARGSGAMPTHAYADDGAYTVTLVVTDPGGLADTASTTATVTNVAPTATFKAPASVPVSTGFTISLTNPSDPSSVDTAAGFTYRFDCGSGFGSWGTASSRNCPGRSSTGNITVRGRIRDKDLGYKTYSRTVDIAGP